MVEQANRSCRQYVILGTGLDSSARRRPDIASRLKIFEIGRPGPQVWKRRRLGDLGLGRPDWLRFVPVAFEAGASWHGGLAAAGFDARQPAIVASTGVSIYLTRDANSTALHEVAALAPAFVPRLPSCIGNEAQGVEQHANDHVGPLIAVDRSYAPLHPRCGRRTALTVPLVPHPQKN